jgi:dihydropteroate synthase
MAAAMDWTVPLARGGRLRITRTLVMGILNATPDSFSDGGRLATDEDVRARVRSMLEAGADILDIGGESTRPGHALVPAEEETARVLPVLRTAREVAPDIPISIDTRKAQVAKVALAAGASLVNDVSALGDAEMARVVRAAGCSVVLMRHADLDADVVASCRAQLAGHLAAARAAGLRDDQLLVDPGLGFGTPPGSDPRHNLHLIGSVRDYSHGRPVVVGASRKRFIGGITGVADPGRRVAGSVAAAILAAEAGAAIVRVHDVPETVQALRVLQARSGAVQE